MQTKSRSKTKRRFPKESLSICVLLGLFVTFVAVQYYIDKSEHAENRIHAAELKHNSCSGSINRLLVEKCHEADHILLYTDYEHARKKFVTRFSLEGLVKSVGDNFLSYFLFGCTLCMLLAAYKPIRFLLDNIADQTQSLIPTKKYS